MDNLTSTVIKSARYHAQKVERKKPLATKKVKQWEQEERLYEQDEERSVGQIPKALAAKYNVSKVGDITS